MHAGREDLDVRMLGSGRPFVLELLNAQNSNPDQGFLHAGREDLDVRMLGSGRPFVLELHNARNPNPGQGALDAAAAALESADVGVQALGLRLVGREALLRLKASAF